MTPVEPGWGTGRGTFDEYAIQGSDAILRVLLPVPVRVRAGPTGADVVERHATWREVADALGRATADVDGYTHWHALSELPSGGGPPHDQDVDHPAGVVPEGTAAALVRVVESVSGAGVRVVSALPAAWSSTTAPLVALGGPPAVSRRLGPEVVEAPLAALAARWTAHGFVGRAWAVDRSVAIAAPPYADSLVLSGGHELRDALLGTDLEVFAVSRAAPCPITSA